MSLAKDGSRAAATQSYGIADPGTLGGSMTFAYVVNDAGQVVAYSTTAKPIVR